MSAPPSPSGEGVGGRGARPWRLIAVTAAILAIRLAVGGTLHLTEDEAYYRLWARAPALGYYDHPPMVAWGIWLGVRLAGDTPLGVRLLPCLACALTSLLVFDLARLAGGSRRDAERAGIWYNAMPLVTAGGFLAVPDAPAALFWTVSLWSALRAQGGGASPGGGPFVAWWLAAGTAAGLAALSKYSALFLGPGMLVWLASTPSGRASLRTSGPWLALGVAAALFSLNIWWNAHHHWLTFIKQFGRVAPHRLEGRYLLEFLATQALLLNPLLAAFLVRLGGRPERGRGDGQGGPDSRPFILTGLPFIGYLLLHSLHDRIQAHWPAPVYPALAVAAAFAAGRPGWRWPRRLVPGLGLGPAAVIAVWISLPLAGVPLPFDPAAPVRGWPVFAGKLETLRRETGAGWVATTSYGLAAELMDEPAILAPTLQISERARWAGLGRGEMADTSRPGLLVELPRRIDPARLARCFADVRPLGVLDRGLAGGPAKRYGVVLLGRPKLDVVRDGCADQRPR